MKLDKGQLHIVSGTLFVITYCLAFIISYLFYPYELSPLHDYISYLGDYNLNPSGAIYYNIGVIVTALFMGIYFSTFSSWEEPLREYYKRAPSPRAFLAVKIIGLGESLSLALIGIFVNDTPPHILIAQVFFVFNFLFVLSTQIILYHYDVVSLFTRIFAGFILIFNIVYVTEGGTIVEWVTVGNALIYVALLVKGKRKLDRLLNS